MRFANKSRHKFVKSFIFEFLSLNHVKKNFRKVILPFFVRDFAAFSRERLLHAGRNIYLTTGELKGWFTRTSTAS